MYSFIKSKKGFTLIELMVVVAIIGVLALLGLRLYTGQQEKAKNAIVKANAGTIQTLIQAELADADSPTVWGYVEDATSDGLFTKSGIHNPIDGNPQDSNIGTDAEAEPTFADTMAGDVYVYVDAAADPTVFYINGVNAPGDNKVYENDLTAKR